jgi:hypothetical protein
MTASDRDNISNPAAGLMVYVTDDDMIYVYTGAAWVEGIGSCGWEVSGNDVYTSVSGNVGIGTSSPSYQLDIAKAGSNQYEHASMRLDLYSEGSDAFPFLNYARSHSSTMGDKTSASAVTQDGDVLGRMSFSGVRVNGSGGSSSGAGWFEMIQKGATSEDGVPGQFQITTSSGTAAGRNTRMVVSPQGFVGIGTTAPTNALHVYSTAGNGLRLQGDDGWMAIELADQTAAQTAKFGFGNCGNGITSLDISNRKTGGTINFYTPDGGTGANTTRMTISTDGKVGIGTTGPTEALDVEGNIDLNGNQIKNMVIETRTSDPASPAVGQIWLRTDL